ncbi:hypothetical protein RUND412_009569 [Rhizina undulata]
MPTEKEKMLRGKFYLPFSTELVKEREQCSRACQDFNNRAKTVERLERIGLWNKIVGAGAVPEVTDEKALDDYPWVEPPFYADYGYNIKLGVNVFINFNCTILDSCEVTIKARTLIGPNVSLFAVTHPLEAEIRNGTAGPEFAKKICIEEDCWLGGNVCVLPGVTIGRGSVVGAGAVVTRDVPPGCVVAGNPARVIRKILPGEKRPENPQDLVVKAETTDDESKVLLERLSKLEAEMKDIKERLLSRKTQI